MVSHFNHLVLSGIFLATHPQQFQWLQKLGSYLLPSPLRCWPHTSGLYLYLRARSRALTIRLERIRFWMPIRKIFHLTASQIVWRRLVFPSVPYPHQPNPSQSLTTRVICRSLVLCIICFLYPEDGEGGIFASAISSTCHIHCLSWRKSCHRRRVSYLFLISYTLHNKKKPFWSSRLIARGHKIAILLSILF